MSAQLIKPRGGSEFLNSLSDVNSAGGKVGMRLYQVTGPSSYTTGGETWDLSADFPGGVHMVIGENAGYRVQYVESTGKLQWLDRLNATAANLNAEMANATDLDGETVNVAVFGWL